MLRFDDHSRTLDLGVHDLLDAVPPSGHLRLQAAWSARARMKAGQQVHTAWQGARAEEDEGFRREVTVRHRCLVLGWEVCIQGRLDGLSREGQEVVVEELKSSALPGARLFPMTAEHFPSWTKQLQLYLHFLAADGQPARGRLIVESLADGYRHLLEVRPDRETGAWLNALLSSIIRRREERLAWLHRRRLGPVPFAHEGWRPGQEDLSREVAEALRQGRHLLLVAPTGYGKTAAVLHAAIQVAWATDRRVLFATARTTQQRMAEESLRAMAERGLPLRAVSIRAREKICLNEVVACRPDACEYARDYHDKVAAQGLISRAWQGSTLDPDQIVSLAGPARACPFALSMDLVAEADVVVADYNYVFDPSVRLDALAEAPGEWIVLVDEAHNLPDRAMGYASPRLLRSTAQQALAMLQRDPAFEGIARVAEEIALFLEEGAELAAQGEVALSLEDGLQPRRVRRLAEEVDAVGLDYVLLRHERPLLAPGEADPWLDIARAVLRLRSALDRAGEETVCIWRLLPRGEVELSLLCRDPSPILRPLFDSLAASALLSATLHPTEFYASLCGLDPERQRVARFSSPFPPENLRVLLFPQVSTEYRHRARDRAATAALVSGCLRSVSGNVAVFFSSFALLDDLRPLLELGERPVLEQGRRMGEAERADLLETMARGEGHILLGVLGGIFAEGVDLPGAALTAAILVGPALPMANLERKLLQAWYQQQYEEGYRYAWLVPAMARVVQAAGRVVRTAEDKGVVMLIDQRFLRRDFQEFFPEDWRPQRGATS